MFGWLKRLRKKSISSSHELLEHLLRGGQESMSGVSVDTNTAMRHATVYACVRILSEGIAQLPCVLYSRDGRSKNRATDNPLYTVLHDQPNSWQTAFEYWENVIAHLLLRGNHYSFKNVVSGSVRELIPFHPDRVETKQRDDLSLVYQVTDARGSQRIYEQPEIFHIRALGSNGFTGTSPIAQSRESIGMAIAAEAYGAKLFANRAVPGLVLRHPATLDDTAYKRLQEHLDSTTGGPNVHKTFILEEGMSAEKIGLTPEDAQFLQTRVHQRREIAAIFRVPPYKLGDVEQQPRANVEQLSLEFLTDTLLPWARRIEQAISRDLIGIGDRSLFAEFLVDGILRGDIKSRYDAYKTAIMYGIMSPNEVRERENLNPREGGDEFFVPLNLGGTDAGNEGGGGKGGPQLRIVR